MPRINIPTIHVPTDQCRREIDAWANSEETRNLAFFEEIFQAFQYNMREYYNAGATPEDRFQRLGEIRQAITEIGFTDGRRDFTIAPTIDSIGRKTCPEGEKCVGGACVREVSSN